MKRCVNQHCATIESTLNSKILHFSTPNPEPPFIKTLFIARIFLNFFLKLQKFSCTFRTEVKFSRMHNSFLKISRTIILSRSRKRATVGQNIEKVKLFAKIQLFIDFSIKSSLNSRAKSTKSAKSMDLQMSIKCKIGRNTANVESKSKHSAVHRLLNVKLSVDSERNSTEFTNTQSNNPQTVRSQFVVSRKNCCQIL